MSVVDEDTEDLTTREVAQILWRGMFGGYDKERGKRVVGLTEKVDRLWWIGIAIAALLAPSTAHALGANTNLQQLIAEKLLHAAVQTPP